jgi:predicted RNA-binding Zn ribbon-like protein
VFPAWRWGFAGERHEEGVVAQIRPCTVASGCRPRLVSHGPGLPFHFHYASVRAGLASRVTALTAAGLAHAIDDGAGSRLRVCNRAGCGTAFIDISRNGRRHFCSVRCANQVNVANHRRRQRLTAAR